METTDQIVLIGFSGAGKSTVATSLAQRIGWRVVDTDAEIEQEFGCTVPEIFASRGEQVFRAAERTALLDALETGQVIIATGGGAVVEPALWSEDLLRNPKRLTVALDVDPETVLNRLRKQQESFGSAVERPMIAGDEPLGRITDLKARRQSVYDQADLTLIVNAVSPDAVAEELLSLLSREMNPAVGLQTPSGRSDIYVRNGIVEEAGRLARARWPRAVRAWIISDETVANIHGEPIAASFAEAGFHSNLHTVPVGESSKSWSTAGEMISHLLDGGIERGDIVVALGGGVIGDLAGFVAAIVLRGVGLVQIPTSLLSMVDSSIGGKTGVNHRTGKNLIGAFYQPPLVIVDPGFLATLPKRELNAGWAEIIKHGVIQPSTPGGERGDLLKFIERNIDNLQNLREPSTTYLIKRNIQLKAAVVEADERETGIRAYLNYGHTIGHGIEAAGYSLIHGEAVALGIRGVNRIAQGKGLVSEDFVRQVDALLDQFELPNQTVSDEALVMAKMKSDKKRVAGAQRWVMPLGSGGVEIRTDVDERDVRAALQQVLSR